MHLICKRLGINAKAPKWEEDTQLLVVHTKHRKAKLWYYTSTLLGCRLGCSVISHIFGRAQKSPHVQSTTRWNGLLFELEQQPNWRDKDTVYWNLISMSSIKGLCKASPLIHYHDLVPVRNSLRILIITYQRWWYQKLKKWKINDNHDPNSALLCNCHCSDDTVEKVNKALPELAGSTHKTPCLEMQKKLYGWKNYCQHIDKISKFKQQPRLSDFPHH